MDNNDLHLIHLLVDSDENVKLVRELLETGTDLNIDNVSGGTLLHVATMSMEDNPETVQSLIEAGCDVRQVNKYLDTPLHYAVMFRKRKVVELLLKMNIDINCKNRFLNTPLHHAVATFNNIGAEAFIRHPNLEILRKLLDHPQINVDVSNRIDETPLGLAIRQKRLDMVKMLLKKNARVSTLDKDNGFTHLHLALYYPDPYIIVALLLKKANVLEKNKDGKTALDIIIKLGHLAKDYLRVIAFNYDLKEVLESKIQSLELSQFLIRCWKEISRMKSDIIADELTVFDFFSMNPAKSIFNDPLLQIYKPVIERLANGVYPEYFCYILNRISESKLIAVLEIINNQEYFNIKSDVNCRRKLITNFLKIARLGLLAENLSFLDIFNTFVALTSMENDESKLDFRNHECYLTDLWEHYSDEHFK